MLDSSSSVAQSAALQMLSGGAVVGQHPPTEFPTTMMVRNLPADLSISELVSLLNQEGFKGLYDYVHIAGDQGARSKSYGFINFVAPAVAMKFKAVFTGKPIQGRDILRVAEVLYAKGHGFKQNITHRINLHGTKVFLFGSGEELPLPRDSAMVQTVVEINRPAQDRLRAQLAEKPDIADMHALRLELALNESEISTSVASPSDGAPMRVTLAPSLFGPNPDLATLSAALAGTSSLTGASLEESAAAPLHLFVFPRALAGLGAEVETLEKLVGQRMRWQITAVISGSAFCEAVESLLTRAITDVSVKVAALVAPGDVAAVAADSAVLLEFVAEELNRVDAVFTMTGDAAALAGLMTQIPSVKCVPNLFTLGTALRKLVPSAVAVAPAQSQSRTSVGASGGSRGQVTITKQIWPSFARNLEQGGMRPVLQTAAVGTRATVLDVHVQQAVLLLQVQNPNGTRSAGFLPIEFTDYVA